MISQISIPYGIIVKIKYIIKTTLTASSLGIRILYFHLVTSSSINEFMYERNRKLFHSLKTILNFIMNYFKNLVNNSIECPTYKIQEALI